MKVMNRLLMGWVMVRSAVSMLLLILSFYSSSANADILRCSFTEPFWDFTYSTTTNEMALTMSGEGPDGSDLVEVKKNVSFQIKSAGEFELWAADKTVIAKLKLNWKGTNGMSDHVFPFEVQYYGSKFPKLIGGCSSNFLHSYLPPGGAH